MSELADRLPPRLGRLVRAMVAVKLALAAIATLVLPLTFTMVVIFRYFLHADLFAYEEWLLPVAFWLYFLGSSVGSYADAQLRADLLDGWLSSARARWIRRLVAGGLELVILCAAVWWAWLTVASDIAVYPNWQATVALGIPYALPHLAALVGFAFMTLYGLLHLVVLVAEGPEPAGEAG